ncbi:CRM-domain containing factor CFM2, chloroplastic [Olea europaea subsp. europaea]|uniref:CRM-domain containing factor CFM2, chloroplastic n=1 Tax=Olea europaea subsp. europaea TaxID=158383 RepID=A0A8S0U6J2_OLEEU|nr:CRM-domain containing factor CFM2, chloroplastic [Olea europaea subsp. europaea]
MLNTLCSSRSRNHEFCYLIPSKTLVNPSPQIPHLFFSFPRLPFKPLLHQASAARGGGSSADSGTLPQSAIQRISEKLRSLGYVEEDKENPEKGINYNGSPPGEIFVPLPTKLPKYRVGHTLDPSWSTPENPVPVPGSGNAIQNFHELRRGVLKEEEEERLRRRGEEKGGSTPSLAELTLPGEELRRLRSIGIGLKKKLKVGKAGITEGIVNGIHERWRHSELVKIKCEDICRLNMKRTHDLLERKTGGLVIWRSGSNIILYRGSDYKYPYFFTDNNSTDDASNEASLDLDINDGVHDGRDTLSSGTHAMKSPEPNSLMGISHPRLIQGVGLPDRVRFQLPGEAQLAEEADMLLEGLGPRFTDWWGYDPLPVDADLLPAIVPGYKRSFRLLPYGVKNKLTNDEMTTLKRLGRPLPCHFALGRNKKLQGLAASIVKLWEKCEIAKIAIKRGVQNTNSEMMAEELKWLTGGTLLSRDKEFIVFYRGKDFLPAAVSSAIEERRKYGMDGAKTGTDHDLNVKERKHETVEYGPQDGHHKSSDEKLKPHSEERKLRHTKSAIERTNSKLSMALAKKARAEKLLEELDKEEIPQQLEIDKEGITEEERYMLRKVGLRMKPFLLLGRRGVFDGTVENMHLHWKYRELVKVLIGRRTIEEVHGVARSLEAESGGILVAVERVSKGYAIIIYRGKNYKRPASLRPQTLLSKREAMKRSIEAQRRESLKLHVLKLTRNIDELKLRLSHGEDKDSNDMQLAKDLEHEVVKEGEMNKIPVTQDAKSDRNPKIDHQSYSGSASLEEARGSHEAVVTCTDTMGYMDTAIVSVHQQDLGESLQSEAKGEDVFYVSEAGLQLKSVTKETKGSLDINVQDENFTLFGSPDQTSYCSTAYVKPLLCDNKAMTSNVGFREAMLESSIDKSMGKGSSGTPFRARRLSNRERLLLRKQALKLKRLPVLAIGKSNVITGVAKAIKAHFQKHPLAIVNVKGRAKGTSVQEVIFQLEVCI